MTRLRFLLTCAILGASSCGDFVAAPTVPSVFSGAKSALLCIGVRDSILELLDEDHCASTSCEPQFNAVYFHRCSDGWPDPQPGGSSLGVARVRVSVAAFRGGEIFWTQQFELDLAPDTVAVAL